MNDKKAKMLRKIARSRTVGLPDRSYVDAGKTVVKGDKSWWATCIRLDPKCTRSVYHDLKRKTS